MITTDTLAARPATLAEAFALFRETVDLSPAQLEKLGSDLRVGSRMTGVELAALPCDPTLLRPLLGRVLPARFRKAPCNALAEAKDGRDPSAAKRWSNIRSTINRVLLAAGWTDPREGCRQGLTPAWRRHVDHFGHAGSKGALGGFARHCTLARIEPEAVTAATLDAYHAWLNTRTLEKNPLGTVGAVRCLWNRALSNDPALPGQRLPRPQDPRQVALRLDELDPAFVADMQCYLGRLAHSSPLDPAFHRKLAPATIAARRQILTAAASTLIKSGLPAGATRSVADVVHPDRLRIVLEAHFHRVGKDGGWAPSAMPVAAHLKAAARQWGRLTPELLAQSEAMLKMVKAPKPGLGSKSRNRVAAFDDPRLMKRLLDLPQDRSRRPTACWPTARQSRRHACMKRRWRWRCCSPNRCAWKTSQRSPRSIICRAARTESPIC